eukprot:4835165-Pleurochrysis_carterae.AAC.1
MRKRQSIDFSHASQSVYPTFRAASRSCEGSRSAAAIGMSCFPSFGQLLELREIAHTRSHQG